MHHKVEKKKQLQCTYCQISQEVKPSDNEIWSVNRIYHKKHFSGKIILKVWWKNYNQTLFHFA